MDEPPFDVDAFLAQPLVARVATNGPTVRPVWYLWEDGVLWWLTGPWSRLADHLARDPRVMVVIDSCDVATGQVRQVVATGAAEVVAYDADRAHRKLARYLGPNQETWDPRFTEDGSTNAFVRLEPDRLTVKDLSYCPPRA